MRSERQDLQSAGLAHESPVLHPQLMPACRVEWVEMESEVSVFCLAILSIARRILLACLYQSAPLLNCALSVGRHLQHVKVLVHAHIDLMANLGLSAGAASAYDMKGDCYRFKDSLRYSSPSTISQYIVLFSAPLCLVRGRILLSCREKSRLKAARPGICIVCDWRCDTCDITLRVFAKFQPSIPVRPSGLLHRK